MEASSLVQTLLLVPMEYTLYVACLRITSQRDKLPWWEVFAANIKRPKQNWFIPVAKTLSVVLLGIVTLGIGGVIGMYALSMVYFIADENPDMSVDDVFKGSMDLTAGYKWKIFVLDLAFLGWYALIVFLASTLEVLRLTIPSDIVLVVGLMFILSLAGRRSDCAGERAQYRGAQLPDFPQGDVPLAQAACHVV